MAKGGRRVHPSAMNLMAGFLHVPNGLPLFVNPAGHVFVAALIAVVIFLQHGEGADEGDDGSDHGQRWSALVEVVHEDLAGRERLCPHAQVMADLLNASDADHLARPQETLP